MRLRVAVALLLLAACGDTTPPELRTTTAPAVVPVDEPRLPPPTTTTTATVAPPVPVAPPPPTTTTTAPPVPPAPTRGDGCLGWHTEIAAVFPAEQVGTACRVMACETAGTGSPTIHNASSTASGLFQFLDGTWESTTGLPAPAAAHPAGTQIAAAHQLWTSSGWSPWACY